MRWLIAGALAALVVVAACVTSDDVKRRADERHEAGEITKQERDAVHETADSAGSNWLADLVEWLPWAAGAALAGYLGIKQRGRIAAAVRRVVPKKTE